MVEHDFKNYPELTNSQIDEIGFQSPHKQIQEDFRATVVKVHDGDTVSLRTDFRDFTFPLRLLDIDTKELNEGGQEAGDWVRDRLEGEEVEIKIDRKNRVDKYGRLLGRVFHTGMDLGTELMMLGLATPFEQRREGQIPPIEKELNIKKWL